MLIAVLSPRCLGAQAAVGVLNRKFLFALTVVALLAAKFLHLFSHFVSVSLPLFVLYFPTFVTPDIFVIVASRIIFPRSLIVSVLLCLVITLGSAAQVGLFLETGGELRWSMLAKIFREPRGFMGMLLTGVMSTAAYTTVLAVVSYFLNPALYNMTGRGIDHVYTTIIPRRCRSRGRSNSEYHLVRLDDGETDDGEEDAPKTASIWARVRLAVVIGGVFVLYTLRPPQPFGHMTGTLPFTMFDAIFQLRSPMCDPAPWGGPRRFPIPDLIREDLWRPATDVNRGWQPGSPWWTVTRERPSWLPSPEMPGFAKWYRGTSFQLPPDLEPGQSPNELDTEHPPPHHGPPGRARDHAPEPRSFQQHPPGYDSVLDPLKIDNSGEPLVDELRDLLQEHAGPEIKHIILMSLESTRKDVFPLERDGRLYQEIQKSWSRYEKRDDEKRDDAKRADLSQFSLYAEIVTGQNGGFGRHFNTTHGGLNVQGAVSSSTFTLKSMLSSHCGVNPLPVDFLEEIESEIYQPCLPQVLKMMNAQNGTGSPPAPWKSVFMQASTTSLDRQVQLMEQMSFDRVIDRDRLRDPDAEFPIDGPELNYFGYSETTLKPYIRKAITDAEEQRERLFLSHLTTSTHHPWATPEEFGAQENYFGDGRAGPSPFNRYLNTIKFADQWVGDVLSLLDELEVANKTLVVILGDHGSSFGDGTSSLMGTYSNPHIVSFQVPLVFYHPLLPRMSLNATVSQMTVVPTILDLLQSTGSLDAASSAIARDLIPEYEGQSLIRPFLPEHDGRQSWNFGVVNPGGTHLSITSAAYPSYRYVMPICESSPFTFTHLTRDPNEARPVQSWAGGKPMAKLAAQQHGDEAGWWVREAERVGRWYVWEARRRWGYWSGSRMQDRGFGHREDGVLRHDHWWNP